MYTYVNTDVNIGNINFISKMILFDLFEIHLNIALY